jgi:hypothetical protein
LYISIPSPETLMNVSGAHSSRLSPPLAIGARSSTTIDSLSANVRNRKRREKNNLALKISGGASRYGYNRNVIERTGKLKCENYLLGETTTLLTKELEYLKKIYAQHVMSTGYGKTTPAPSIMQDKSSVAQRNEDEEDKAAIDCSIGDLLHASNGHSDTANEQETINDSDAEWYDVDDGEETGVISDGGTNRSDRIGEKDDGCEGNDGDAYGENVAGGEVDEDDENNAEGDDDDDDEEDDEGENEYDDYDDPEALTAAAVAAVVAAVVAETSHAGPKYESVKHEN